MKTTSEFICERIDKIHLIKSNIDYCIEKGRINGSLNLDLKSFAKDCIKFNNRWIPVDKELPENNLPILFKEMNNNARIHFGYRSQCVNNFVEMGITFKNITHWRPIENK
jgi:hypothetical protein